MTTAGTFRPGIPLPLLLLFLSSFLLAGKSEHLPALVAVRSGFSGGGAIFDSWKELDSSPCGWSGITCDAAGNVTEIVLSGRNLTGEIRWGSLCGISSLRKLDLSGNLLGGSIPPEINNCSGLSYLDLSFNRLNGAIPELFNLWKLNALNLSDNAFTGPFPASSLKNKPDLEWLSLGDNEFDPSFLPDELFANRKLKWIYLSMCNIQGMIPAAIGGLTELVNLELADNNLNGTIPPELTNLTKLWRLELYHNDLTGKFPTGFGKLTNLACFDASRNSLEGDLSEFKSMSNLLSLQLFENNLSGEVPAEFGQFKYLVNISLYSNSFSGSLPPNLGSWSEFDFIDISDNLFSGEIPPDMCKRGTMTKLLILDNKFSGALPSTYANCTSLVRLRVNNNSLSGTIPPGIWSLPNVNIIDLTGNAFEGPVTSEISAAKSLTQLFLSNNRFSGALPPEISEASSLERVELGNNRFSGEVPSTIGDLKKLSRLILPQNQFSGNIPDSLGSCVSLVEINFARNRFSGNIPASLANIPVLNALNLSQNDLSGEIPATFSSLKLSILDLTSNGLTGPIPVGLANQAYNGSFAGNPGLCSVNTLNFRRCSPDRFRSSVQILITCFLLGIAILCAAAGFVIYFHPKSRGDSFRDASWDLTSFGILTFTEQEIVNGMKESNRIGKGGSGEVYRVDLDNGSTFAVKHISNPSVSPLPRTSVPILKRNGRKSKQLEAEVAALSSIRHVNVVKLYCSITSDDSSLLVYEFLPNGSLWDQLHGGGRKMGLDWQTRYRIAIGAAKGLEYLHHGLEKQVIHRDVKSSNILLDEFYEARVADFGLAKVIHGGTITKDMNSTHLIAGTHGYIAPEYGYTYKVTEKSDVYSFGVVLLELVTGKRPMEPEFGDNKDIVMWVSSKLSSKESVMELVDSRIPLSLREEVIKVLRVGLLCTARLPSLRPTMRDVLQMLIEVGTYYPPDDHAIYHCDQKLSSTEDNPAL